MELTLVIVCCDDPRVIKAIHSVDRPIPVVVSLVPNESLEKAIIACQAKVVHSVRGNYSVSVNRGLAAVETPAAFIIDSDCILAPGTLEMIARLLDEAPLGRARIAFDSDPSVRLSPDIAKLRAATNNRRPIRPYTPGLGLRLDLKQKLGGHFFDERIPWTGDSEFSHRVAHAGLPVAYAENAVVHHAPISLRHEIRSGFAIGNGSHVVVELGLRPPWEHPTWLLRRLAAYLLGKTTPVHRPQLGLNARLISLVWTASYYIGYYRRFISRRFSNIACLSATEV